MSRRSTKYIQRQETDKTLFSKKAAFFFKKAFLIALSRLAFRGYILLFDIVVFMEAPTTMRLTLPEKETL